MAGISRDGQHDHQRIADVRCQVIERFDLDAARRVAVNDLRQHLLRCLDEPLGPARLLRLERRHFDGQFGGALNVGEVFEFPSRQLRAVAEVGIFGERVVLPSACVGDGLPPPHAGCAVEIEEDTAARARPMLEDKMPVEQDCLNLREEAVVAVEMGPPRLHHADFRIVEVMDRPASASLSAERNPHRRWR